VRYRYYVCTKAHLRGWASCPTRSVSAKNIEAFVVDKIRGVGRDPELIARTAEEASTQISARNSELAAESKRLRAELEEAHGDLRKSLKAVPRNGGALRTDPGHEDSIRSIEERLQTMEEEISALEDQRIDPEDLRTALALFDPVWSHLEPSEQARVIQLLIERIDYDGGTGNLSISFRPGCVRTLAEEVQ